MNAAAWLLAAKLIGAAALLAAGAAGVRGCQEHYRSQGRDEVQARYLSRIRELLGHFGGTQDVALEIGSLPRQAVAAVGNAASGGNASGKACSGSLRAKVTCGTNARRSSKATPAWRKALCRFSASLINAAGVDRQPAQSSRL